MTLSNQINGCQIWRGYVGVGFRSRDGAVDVEDSPRAGGRYTITREAIWRIEDVGLEDSHKARLTTILVDMRQQGIQWPEVTTALIEEAKNAPPLSVDRRADRLLLYLSNLTTVVGEFVELGTPAVEPDSLGQRPISGGRASWAAMAWSESIQASEVQFLLDYLLTNGWIRRQRSRNGMGHFAVTVDGYSRIANQETAVDSFQAFVAMWIDSATDDAFEKGIRPGIEDAGYKALRIDKKQDVVKIDDEIMSEIRKSRLVVADFTHGKSGVRGGVYFEAGFAEGLGIPVIYTCRKDMVEGLHFDTRQYAHILWDEPEQLRVEIKNRIRARIVGVTAQ